MLREVRLRFDIGWKNTDPHRCPPDSCENFPQPLKGEFSGSIREYFSKGNTKGFHTRMPPICLSFVVFQIGHHTFTSLATYLRVSRGAALCCDSLTFVCHRWFISIIHTPAHSCCNTNYKKKKTKAFLRRRPLIKRNVFLCR